ncbi:23S rRNA (guanine(745)-N(1))-methyltransferase [Rheinheimera sp.]|jgi:23S rRNA (guanine745-N1)-methyltransferase|uniref:23S rRNA (guanine(745)-N(1))-methyltransferase n=1 Tax=Rheinheimera sp. TaxID=1869214 RepID=UPI00261ABB3D|nr:23S rRNA (guanine(745)-N(1))-methyltransferase [Rheinheimera sp.]MCA1928298.1 23S rRNA (guanine(745)-N(1))-methyltransferase [Rheinheimera sp.]
MYLCPLCQQSLTQQNNSFVCGSNHSFDLAKEGYLHLLPVQQKNSKVPGDSALMMQSRRDFLNAGYYQPLSDAVNQCFAAVLPQNATLLDLGCGEGYYSNRLFQALTDKNLQIYGVDIAKTAIKKAAKSYPALRFCVASAWHLPFAEQSFDAALKLCAPCEPEELARVLKADALLLTVTPAPEHLLEIKQQVYSSVRLHSDQIEAIKGFEHQQRQQLKLQLTELPDQMLLNLLEMTPLAWKFKPEQKQSFAASSPQITLNFYLDLYRKNR